MPLRTERDCAPAPRRRDEPAPAKLRRLAPEVEANRETAAAAVPPESPPLWFRLSKTATSGRASPLEGPQAPRQSASPSLSPLLWSPCVVEDDAMCVEDSSPCGHQAAATGVLTGASSPAGSEEEMWQASPERRRSAAPGHLPCALCMRPIPSPSRPFGCIQRATRDFEGGRGPGPHLDDDQWVALSDLQTEIYAHCHRLGAQVARADLTGEWSLCPLKAAERRWRALQACLARLEACLDALHCAVHSCDPLRDDRVPAFRERYRRYTESTALLRAHLLQHVLPEATSELEQRTVFCELFGPERGRTAFGEWRDSRQLRALVDNCGAALSVLDGQLHGYRP